MEEGKRRWTDVMSSSFSSNSLQSISAMPNASESVIPQDHKINVSVRVRPLITREKDKASTVQWKINQNSITHLEQASAGKGTFNFDNVFGPKDTTKNIYDKVVSPMIKEAFNGYSGAVLCYGQTASGKTHTLYGSDNDKGIIDMCADELADMITKNPAFVIKLNLIEIYNEAVKDLFNSKNPIDIALDDGTFVPSGAKDFSVVTAEEIREAARRVQRERTIGETQMNNQSSRSHTILRITISKVVSSESSAEDDSETINLDNTGTPVSLIESVINLVDLAGSESASRTEAKGERFTEACYINKSLSALSKVVNQLSEKFDKENKKTVESSSLAKSITSGIKPKSFKSRMPAGSHISYRDSKLTMLLKSSLGGDALVAIICNVTPASDSVDETTSTLRFASLAKKIHVQPSRKVINKALLPGIYEEKIAQLQLQLLDRDNLLNKKDSEVEALRKKIATFQNFRRLDQPVLSLPLQSDRRKTIHLDKIKKPSLHENIGDGHRILNGQLVMSSLGIDFTTIPIPSAEVALKQFQETKQDFVDTCSGLKCEDTKELITILKINQEAQTEFSEYETPVKKRRTADTDESTPMSTMRMHRNLLSATVDDDRNEWKEEKHFLNEENLLLQKEIDEVKEQMRSTQNLVEENAQLQKEIDDMKTKYMGQIEQLKQSNEYEVDLLSQRIRQRDLTIKELKSTQGLGGDESGLDPLYLEKLKTETGDLKLQLSSLKVCLQQRDADKELQDEEVRIVKEELEELRDSKYSLDKEVTKLSEENSKLVQDIIVLKREHEAEIGELQNERESEMQKICTDKDRALEEVQKLLEDTQKSNAASSETWIAEKQQLQSSIQLLEDEKEIRAKELISVQNEVIEAQNSKTRHLEEVQKLKEIIATANEEIQELKINYEREIKVIKETNESDMERLCLDISDKEETIDELRKELESVQLKISTFDEESYKNLQEKFLSREAELTELKATLQNLDEKNKSMQGELENRNDKNDELQERNTRLVEEVQKLKEINVTINKEVQELKADHDNEMEVVKETNESEMEKLCLDISDKEETIDGLRKELESLQLKINTFDEESYRNLQEKLLCRETELTELKETLQNLDEEKKSMQAELGKRKEKNDELQEATTCLLNEVQKLKQINVAVNEEVQELKANHKREMEVMKESNESEMEILCLKISDKEEIIDELHKEMESLKLKITSIDTDSYKNLQESLLSRETELTELKATLQNLDEEKKSIQEKLENRKDKNDVLQERITRLVEEVQKLKEINATINKEVQELKANHENEMEVVKESNESEMERLCLEISNKEEVIDELRVEMESLKLKVASIDQDSYKNLQEVLLARETELTELKLMQQNLDEEKLTVEQELKKKDVEIDVLQKKITCLLEDVQKLKENTAEVQELKANHEKDMEVIKQSNESEIERMYLDINGKEEIIAGLRNEVDSLKLKVTAQEGDNNLKEKLLSRETELVELKATLQNLDEEKKSIEEEFEKKENKILELQDIIKSLSDEIAEAEANKSGLSQEIKVLVSRHQKEIVELIESKKLEVQNLSLLVNKKEESIKVLKKELDAQKFGCTNKESYDDLYKTLQSRDTEMVELKAMVHKLSDEKQSFEGEIEKKRLEITKLMFEASEKTELMEKAANLSEEIHRKEDTIKELELKLNAKSTSTDANGKYTEKLKEDLRSSWKDNKQLENQVSDLKSLLQLKEEELSAKNSELIVLRSGVVMKPSEAESLRNDITLLTGQIETLKIELQQALDSNVKLNEDNVALKKHIAEQQQQQNLRRPCRVNRGCQTPEDWDQKKVIHELKVRLRLACHRFDQSEKSKVELTRTNKKEIQKLLDELKKKSDEIDALEGFVSKKAKEKDELRERQVETGVQCEYLTELIDRAKKGLPGLLPTGLPDCGKLIKDNKSLVSIVLQFEKSLQRCQCLAEKSSTLLQAGKWVRSLSYKENEGPETTKRENILAKPFVSRMGSAMDRKGRPDWLNSNPNRKTQSPVVFPKNLSVLPSGAHTPFLTRSVQMPETVIASSDSYTGTASNSESYNETRTNAVWSEAKRTETSETTSNECQPIQAATLMTTDRPSNEPEFSLRIENHLPLTVLPPLTTKVSITASKQLYQNPLKPSNINNVNLQVNPQPLAKTQTKEAELEDLNDEMSEWFESVNSTKKVSATSENMQNNESSTSQSLAQTKSLTLSNDELPTDQDELFEMMMNLGRPK